ncbi:retrovirus-related pol polyprotein from transposon TNT 1-94 [Tanacetum coccineum]
MLAPKCPTLLVLPTFANQDNGPSRWVKHSKDFFIFLPNAQAMGILVKTCLMLALKTQNDSFAFVHELKQEMHADLKYVESLENKLDELESDKAGFSNMYDMVLLQNVCLKMNVSLRTKLSEQTELIMKPNRVLLVLEKPNVMRTNLLQHPIRKTVASESTITNSKSYYRMLYKKTNKAWKWWIAQQCPSAYTWVPKTKRKWVPKVRNESVTKKIVQLILFIVDSGCTKHMTGNLSLLVYYVEGLNHNLFSVGQFCDADLEVAFWKSTCFVRDLQGNDLLTGNRGTDLYTISLQETTSSTPICLMAKASPTQAWLWHSRLSHLNFDYINLISKKDVVIGLPKLKYVKDQLCSSCEVSKAKRSSFKLKTVPSSKGRLNLLYTDLCGPMRVASINGKKYIWPEFLTRHLMHSFFKEEGIEHQTSTPRTPEQNGVASDYDNSDPNPQLQNVSPSADTTVPSQQELDFLFGPLYDEFFNTGTSRVNKSSSPNDNFVPQDTHPSTNIQPTPEPTTPTNAHAEENNDNQADDTEHEFTNPFYTPVHEVAESS